MSPEEFRTYGYAAIDWIAHFLEHARDYPVLPNVQPGSLVDALPKSAPEEAEDFAEVLGDFEEQIVPRTTQWNHPRFMGYFAISAAPPGILAELLCAALNTNAILWKSSPASTELEQVTLDWLRQWLGIPEGWFGQILDTASTSTLHAVIAARVRKQKTCADERLVLYASRFAHSSIPKAAYAAGIAKENVRLIEADEKFRMQPELLEAAITEDLGRGLIPFCVVATVGTTSVASIDPVPAIAKICQQHDLWLHVDGAYGASAAVHEKYRWILDGVAEADSLVINPHKWLFTPLDISVLYCKNAEWLREAFSLVPEYLRSKQDPRAVNLGEYGVPLGRRFRSLKLWFTMRAYGRRQLAQRIDEHIEYAKRLARVIEADPDYEVVAPVEFSLVVFRHLGGDERNRRLLDRVNESGVVLVSPDQQKGKQVIRLAIGHIDTRWEDVETAWEAIRKAAGEVAEES